MNQTIRIIGDVHGHLDALASSLESHASPSPHYILLGDLIDRGPDSPGVLQCVMRLVQDGAATLLRSNHDGKLYRHLLGNKVTITTELEETLRQLDQHPDGNQICTDFMSIYEQAPWWLNMDGMTMVHGAFHPDMLTFKSPDEGKNRKARDVLKWLALNGESTQHPDEEKPIRTYEWLKTIPKGHTAIVGHDARSFDQPEEQTGLLGGKVIFMDTGCGRGGKLSWRDYKIS